MGKSIERLSGDIQRLTRRIGELMSQRADMEEALAAALGRVPHPTTAQRVALINRQAEPEGWIIVDNYGRLEIQRDDSSDVFDDDAAAWAHVTDQAAKGSAWHREALALATNDTLDDDNEAC